jgi:hypothetical protein
LRKTPFPTSGVANPSVETPSQERVLIQQEDRTGIEKEAETGGATGASEELAAAVKTSHDHLDLDLGLPRGEGDVRKTSSMRVL